jgi:hypothetical protein
MSVLAFILGLVQALAWPVFVLLIVFVFRSPISEMFNQITRSAKRLHARAGPVEFDVERVIEQSVKELEKEVNEKEIVVTHPPIQRAPAAWRLNSLLVTDRVAAVDQGYKDIENSLKEILENAEVQVSGTADLSILIRQAADHKLVALPTVSIADRITRVVNRAKEKGISPANAYAVMTMFDLLQYAIDTAKPSPAT